MSEFSDGPLCGLFAEIEYYPMVIKKSASDTVCLLLQDKFLSTDVDWGWVSPARSALRDAGAGVSKVGCNDSSQLRHSVVAT